MSDITHRILLEVDVTAEDIEAVTKYAASFYNAWQYGDRRGRVLPEGIEEAVMLPVAKIREHPLGFDTFDELVDAAQQMLDLRYPESIFPPDPPKPEDPDALLPWATGERDLGARFVVALRAMVRDIQAARADD